MSFAKFHLSPSTIDRLYDAVAWTSRNKFSFASLRNTWSLFDGRMQSYVFIGIHSFTVIGDYVFLYEEEIQQCCFHIESDSDDLFKAFQLMCHHSSASTEEVIDLYEGFTVTSRVSTGRTLFGAGLDVASKYRLKTSLALA